MRAGGGELGKGQETIQVRCVGLTDTRGPTDDQRSGRSRKERGDGHGLRVVIRRVRYERRLSRLMWIGYLDVRVDWSSLLQTTST